MEKRIGSYLPIVSVIILVLGTLKQILYYLYFNVTIKFYLSLSEIGLIIADDLMIFSTFLFILFVIITLISHLLGDDAIDETGSNPYRRIVQKKESRLRIYLMSIMALGSITSSIIFLAKSDFAFFLMSITTVLLVTSMYLFLYNKKTATIPFIKENNILIRSSMILLALVLYKTGTDINNTTNSYYKGTTIVTQDTTYISDNTSYFIGQTSNYAFVYSEKTKTTDVIPTKNIKVIKIRTNGYSFFVRSNKKKVK